MYKYFSGDTAREVFIYTVGEVAIYTPEKYLYTSPAPEKYLYTPLEKYLYTSLAPEKPEKPEKYSYTPSITITASCANVPQIVFWLYTAVHTEHVCVAIYDQKSHCILEKNTFKAVFDLFINHLALYLLKAPYSYNNS